MSSSLSNDQLAKYQSGSFLLVKLKCPKFDKSEGFLIAKLANSVLKYSALRLSY